MNPYSGTEEYVLPNTLLKCSPRTLLGVARSHDHTHGNSVKGQARP